MSSLIFSNRLALIVILFIISVFLNYQVMDGLSYSHNAEAKNLINPDLNILNDKIIELLGKSFDEVKQVLGEPDEQGYSSWLGPHYYILYHHDKGYIRFCAPEGAENYNAVSIILGPGQEILEARVGMLFSEIKEILGEPAFGPEDGMDNLYHMGYFFGEVNQQGQELLLSFSAVCIDCNTQDGFIKYEAFE